MADIVAKIGYAMSLRKPQQEALSYLDAISTHCDYKKDSKAAIEAVATEHCEKQRKIKVDDKFDFLFLLCYGNRHWQNPPYGCKYLLSLQDEGLSPLLYFGTGQYNL